MSQHTFIGLDVHARSVRAAVLDGVTGELRSCAAPVPAAELVPWLRAQGESVSVAYEAGPTGFVLARACAAERIPCLVAATSRILKGPRRPRQDRPARRRQAGPLVCASGSSSRCACRTSPRRAPARLVRARDDARRDLMRARQRLSKLLLRRGLLWEGAKSWTLAHERWLAARRFEERPLRVAYEEAQAAMAAAKARRDALDAAIAVEAQGEPWKEVVGRLCCLRGVSTLTAFGLATEIGDWERFVDGRSGPRLPGALPLGELLRGTSPPGGDHQDRQQPRAAPARRGRLAAAPAAAAPQPRAGPAARGAAAPGAGAGRGRRQAPQPALAELRRARQALHGRRRGRRP